MHGSSSTRTQLMANHTSKETSKMTDKNNALNPPPGQTYPTELYRRSTSLDEGPSTKRPRASKPKVKSGCVTCKARRVKCDEAKPHCLRCQKFGRVCDGYAPEPPQSRGLLQLQPRIPSTSLYGPDVSIHSTEDEHRYFQVFKERTALELPGFYDPTFWTRLVLQESHNVAAIRHSVIALGALNKSLETTPSPNNLKVNVIQSIDKNHHQQAIHAHLKAIQSLNHYISSAGSPQLRNALIACLLFVCFETFQGCYASSVQQIYGGLKILRSYYQGKPGSRPWIPRNGAADKPKYKSAHVAKVSNILQVREGCDNVSQERAIAQHVEEYLEHENRPQVESNGHKTQLASDQTQAQAQAQASQSPTDNPEFLLRHMGGTDFSVNQQRIPGRHLPTKPLLPAGQFKDIMPTHAKLSPEPPIYCGLARSSLSGTSTSNPLTPSNYTPPPTAPHTPSTFNPMPANASTAAQVSVAGKKRPLASRSPTPIPLLQNDLTIEEVLIQSFVRLDGSGLFFGMVPGIPPLVWDTHQVWHLPIPSIFTDFPSAQRCWDFLMDRTLQFYRRTLWNRNYSPPTSDPPALITKHFNTHSKQLSLFGTAFQPLLDKAISPDGTITAPAALILSLNLKCVAILLNTVQDDSEMLFDRYTSDFKYIVDTCSRLVASQETTQLPRNTRFSFDTGIVPPLHVTATKCRDPIIRRQAIKLLWESPRQEGMWDSVLSARIGRWLADSEEEGLPPPPVPHDSRESSNEMSGYPSPPHAIEDSRSGGGWENGRRIRDLVQETHGEEEYEAYGPGAKRHAETFSFMENGNGKMKNGARKRSALKNKERERERENGSHCGWVVPEENRVKLMVVDFHIPEKYIKVRCQRALANKDGKKVERETLIAW